MKVNFTQNLTDNKTLDKLFKTEANPFETEYWLECFYYSDRQTNKDVFKGNPMELLAKARRLKKYDKIVLVASHIRVHRMELNKEVD